MLATYTRIVLALSWLSCSARDDHHLTAANLNILHGMFCNDGDHCRLPDRIDLLFKHLRARNCPDIVTLQEVWATARQEIDKHLDECGYKLTQGERITDLDDEAVLSRLPVTEVEQLTLVGGFRRALHVRLDHPVGPVDVYTTHITATTDGALEPCTDCPPECAGAATRRDCQGRQLAQFASGHNGLAIVAGDFNEHPDSVLYQKFVAAGWPDPFLEKNAECHPTSGSGCTSGRMDETLDQMQSTAINENERIDYLFVDRGRCTLAGASLFAEQPNPFAGCGPAPMPMCWPSDHIGGWVDLDCTNR